MIHSADKGGGGVAKMLPFIYWISREFNLEIEWGYRQLFDIQPIEQMAEYDHLIVLQINPYWESVSVFFNLSLKVFLNLSSLGLIT